MTTYALGPLDAKVTINDVQQAEAFFAVLVDWAKANFEKKKLITYAELIARAKERFPNNEAVQSAIPVAMGRKMEALRKLTEPLGFPDLTSMVISKATEEVGYHYPTRLDPLATREKAFLHDWSDAPEKFDAHVREAITTIIPRTQKQSAKRKAASTSPPKIKEETAAKMMYEYYKENSSSLSPSIKSKRDLNIKMLSNGSTAEEAFTAADNQLTGR